MIEGKPFSSISEVANYFNVKPKTIKRHLDTKLITKQNNIHVYFFGREINLDLKMELLNNSQKPRYARGKIWVYKLESKGKLILLPNQPFKSIREVIGELKVHSRIVKKYLDTNLEHKGFLMFSHPVDNFNSGNDN